MLHLVLFLVFGGICVAGAINLVAQRHPINSALSLIVVMGSLAVLYLLLGAEFVAAIQIIVYAGAIMVLFIFVIMLLNAAEEEQTQGSKIALFVGAPSVAALICMVVYVLTRHLPTGQGIELGKFVGTTQVVAMKLFTTYLLPFEVTSVLIL